MMWNRSKLMAAILLVAVFAAGAVTGGAVSSALADRPHERDKKRDRPSYVERLDRQLSLRPEQRRAIQEIVDDYQEAMKGLWGEVRPRFQAIRLDVRERIAGTLDSAQAETYRALIARSDSLHAARERGTHENR